MITIYCALYVEAQYLIQHYELKKTTESRHFQIFFNEKWKIRLVITGVGKLNATVAMAEISTIYPPAEEDLMVNYGSCAAEGMLMPGEGEGDGGACVPLGSIIMVNKLTDAESGRTFYPDMVYRHPFAEGEVVTSAQVYTADAGARDGGTTKVEDVGLNAHAEGYAKVEAAGLNAQNEEAMKAEVIAPTVHDMEAAAFYEAGNFYYGPHQMIFLKVVTDHGIEKDRLQNDSGQGKDIGNEKNITSNGLTINQAASERERFAMIMQEAGAEVAIFIDGLYSLFASECYDKKSVGEKMHASEVQDSPMETFCEDPICEWSIDENQLAEDLHCSVTMKAELMQLLKYWRLTGFDAASLLHSYYEQELLPCKDKREGRRLLDELQNKWL